MTTVSYHQDTQQTQSNKHKAPITPSKSSCDHKQWMDVTGSPLRVGRWWAGSSADEGAQQTFRHSKRGSTLHQNISPF